MTRLLIAYDASHAARDAVAAAAALFPHAEAAVACVAPPAPAVADETLLVAGLPDGRDAEELEALQQHADDEAAAVALEGAGLAASAGLRSEVRGLPGGTPWRALLAEARRRDSDVIVCGTRGERPLDRVLLGSTASSLLHHADRPLLVVPATAPRRLDGPLLAGYDGSPGAEGALRFAAEHAPERPVVVAHAWRSPVRRTARGRALLHAHVPALHEYATGMDEVFGALAADVAADGVRLARELGLSAEPLTPEGHRAWLALLNAARECEAAAIIVGACGRGAVASTVLGSVASALVHAAALPVLVVDRAAPLAPEASA